jgi:photosystem II stability/assembly factor-like uncharacterized protein
MRVIKYIGIALTLIVVSFCSCGIDQKIKSQEDNDSRRMEDKLFPAEGHILAQNYPEERFAIEAYRSALSNVKKQRDISYRVGNWEQQGPGNIGGRVNSIAVSPENGNEMLLGYSLGGVFKTQDNGDSWEPLFDNEDILSISDVTYDPNNPDNIYVGTGDLNITGYPVTGNGIFKSIDGGSSWERKGLTDAGVIAEVGISKANSDIVYAASMGLPFEKTEDRGLYKSEDGGENWDQVFFLNDSTGVIDIEVHPTDPNIVYAATWTRIRNNRKSIIESDQTGIFKTIDGGLSWTRLMNGLPTGSLVRPGLAMYEGNPDIIYSLFITNVDSEECSSGFRVEGIYKTADEGESWVQIPSAEENGLPCNVLGGFGWYFGQIRVNPIDENDIHILGVSMYNTKDGGLFWEEATPHWSTYEVHADKHDLVYNGNQIILATDGGAYRLEGEEWVDIENIISTQFYRVATSNFDDNYYGGAQDNGSTGGTVADVNDWPRIFGGDGFQMIFHPTDPNIWYVEFQNGNIRVTLDGGENYTNGTVGLVGSRNWDMQYIMSSSNPNVLYTGTDRIFRSESFFAPSWMPLSGNLTDTVDLSFARTHNITTLDESPVNTNYLYCGTSDGLVWRSLDLGVTWEQINEGLPRRYISDIKTSRSNANTVYVTIQGYKDNDFTPYIYKSTNNGDTWEFINGNLPQIAINDILLPENDDEDLKIFVATDGGVYYTEDAGISWIRLGDDMPIVPVYDLAIGNNNELIAGTFARGIYTYDLAQLENLASEDISISRIHLYPTITESQLTVEGLEIGERIEIINSQGIKMMSYVIRTLTQNIDISSLSQGHYYVRPSFGKASKFIKI